MYYDIIYITYKHTVYIHLLLTYLSFSLAYTEKMYLPVSIV